MADSKQLTLYGVMAVTDKFGRIRILLETDSLCVKFLQKKIPPTADLTVPYEIYSHPADGIAGVVWCTVPARYRALWLKTAEELRNKKVRAEVTMRGFNIRKTRQYGVSLDVRDLKEVISKV
jgi:hypothetical protein